MLNPTAQSVDSDFSARNGGLIGLGPKGLYLVARIRETGFRSFREAYPIDVSSWEKADIPSDARPEVWLDDWNLRVPISDEDTFVTRLSRTAPKTPA